MPPRDIIVVGASAGGVRLLQELVRGLPTDLSASIFVVLHLPAGQKSHLPQLLSCAGSLPAMHPADHEIIRRGQIYVAPPDRHLIMEDGRVNLWHGPKENRHRPAVNALFRTAAAAYGPRVVGVVLSGVLDDGAAGLWWIKQYGGLAIVQNPMEAEHPEMPQNALDYVDVDYVLGISEIPAMLVKLAEAGKPVRNT